MFYGFAGLSVLFFCTVCCMITKIRIAIALMETAADFVTEVPLVMAVPPVITIFVLIWGVTWLYCFAYVFSTGNHVAGELGWFLGYVDRTPIEFYSCWYFVFIFLWINAFLGAVN